MNVPFLDLSKPEAPWLQRLDEAAVKVIHSGRYLHGAQTDRLEQRLKGLFSTQEAVGVSNGLDAIRLIIASYLHMGRLHEGDEVAVPANTYIASVLPITEFNLKPLFIDVETSGYNMNLELLEKKITSKTKAVMLVHLYGTPVWDARLMHSMRDKGILIIEDNAQAIGAHAPTPGFNGATATGGLGDASALSFYPTKNIGALGDAGAVATSDKELAATVRTLANYGSDRRYHNITEGYNCRIDELQAAFLNVKLDYLNDILESRARTARIYCGNIDNPAVTTPVYMTDRRQVWHQYVIRTDRRDELKAFLAQKGIGTDIHYPCPPYAQPCYRGVFKTDCKVADRLSGEILSLPIAAVDEEAALYVCETINSFR